MLDANSWTRFMKDCDNNEWKEFEMKERLFRDAIATKPMNIRRSYQHENPCKWNTLTTMLTYLFFRNGVFSCSKPNTAPYSMNFLKYVIRILKCYPVDLPDQLENDADIEYDIIVQSVYYMLSQIVEHICPWLHDVTKVRRAH